MTTPASTMSSSDVRSLRHDVAERIKASRQEYRELDRSIKRTLDLGTVRPGRANKLKLSTSALMAHMAQRDTRASLQHRLLVLVPLERALRIGLQQKLVFGAGSPHLKPLRDLLLRRATSQMPAAFTEVQFLFAKLPALFGAMPATLCGGEKSVNEEKARSLHSKLLASGLLTGDELETLRTVFAQYRA